jgi:hypothetical protein
VNLYTEKQLEQMLKIAADDVDHLRTCDVFRVLDMAYTTQREPLAEYIRSKRPMLVGEVDSCLRELYEEDENSAREMRP